MDSIFSLFKYFNFNFTKKKNNILDENNHLQKFIFPYVGYAAATMRDAKFLKNQTNYIHGK